MAPSKTSSSAWLSGFVPSSLLSTEEGTTRPVRGLGCLSTPPNPRRDCPWCLAVGRADRPPLEGLSLGGWRRQCEWREGIGQVRILLVTTLPLITDSSHSHSRLPAPRSRGPPQECTCFAAEAAVPHCLSVSTQFGPSSCLSGRRTIYGAAALHS